jgi:acetyl-CoA carboxylase biotin carboxyl carrier protein
LRSPQALLPVAGGIVAAGVGATEQPPIDAPIEDVPQERSGHRVLAPLTGVFYLSPSPEAEPYVHEGAQVNTGQVIGLIEAMKLFNEIKSDVTGTVRRITASDGDLVKAKEPLIEVDPA